MARFFGSVIDEERMQRDWDAQRSRQESMEAAADPGVAQRVSSIRQKYPWMTPGAALAVAKGGWQTSPEAKEALALATARRKAKRGFGWHSIGDFLEWQGGKVLGVAKPAVRGAFTVLQAPAELVDAGARAVAGGDFKRTLQPWLRIAMGESPDAVAASDPLAQETNFGVALEKMAKGERVDQGRGFFPGGEVAAQQAENARSVYSVDGHAGTVGRILASHVTEPGTGPYNFLSGLTDATVDIFADPAAHGLGSAAKARKASKSFVRMSAGLVDGAHRPDVVTKVAAEWLDGRGRKLAQDVAAEGDFYKLWRGFKGNVPAATAAQLADAKTEEEVLGIFRKGAGVDIEEIPDLGWSPLLKVKRQMHGIRLFANMPGRHVNPDDIDDVVSNVDDWLINLRAPEEVRGPLLGNLARSENRNAVFTEMENVMSTAAGLLTAEHKLDPKDARGLTRMFREQSDLNAWFVREQGDNAHVLGAILDGAKQALPTPHLPSEYLQRSIPLPDARKLREATAYLGKLRANGVVDVGVDGLDAIMNEVWKPLQLIRPAWMIRVVGDEQMRMAAAGLRSVVNHPLSVVADMLARSRGEGKRLGKGKILGATGEPLSDSLQFKDALTNVRRTVWGEGMHVQTMGKRLARRGDDDYAEGLADELAVLANDPLARRVAGGFTDGDGVPGGLTGNHVDDAKRWWWEGTGRKIRSDVSDAARRDDLRVDRAVADGVVDSVQERILIKTGGDRELIEAVANGTWKGNPLSFEREMGGFDLDKGFIDHLSGRAAGGLGPETALADRVVSAGGKANAAKEFKDKAVGALFSGLMGRPSNYLSRSKAFEQFYWQQMSELAPRMTRGAQDAALGSAKATKLHRSLRNPFEAKVGKVTGDLALEDADWVAKSRALGKTREMLYDLGRRSQFFDMARLASPFGEAWLEMLKTWGKILKENPVAARRFQMTIEGGREGGFFFEDPQTKMEMFAFPGMEFVTEHTIGMPVPMQGSLQGLNLFSNNPLLPGFGPLVALPASKLLPDIPDFDWARQIIMPYGEPDPDEQGIESLVAPAWFKKIQQAWGDPEDEAQFASTFAGASRYLASTGEYDLNNADGLRKLEDDARDLAKRVFAFRGFAQAALPTSPSPKFQAYDEGGKTWSQFVITQRYRELLKEDPESATENFINEFGAKNLLAMQSLTEGRGVAEEEALNWVRENPDVVDKFPDVYRFFAPQGGDFDYTAYRRSIDSGETRPLTSEEFIQRANQRVASMIYRAAKDQLGEKRTPEQTDWLRAIRDKLIDKYPGYDPMPKDLGKTDRNIRQILSAVRDPRLADTDAGRGILLYAEARQMAMDAAKQAGLQTGFGKAKQAAPLRQWLRMVAGQIEIQHPGFGLANDFVFDREMVEDEG